jgi:capsular exopolysaccharide synthesis family protein
MERNSKQQEIDVKKILFKFKTKWYFFALSVVLALAIGFIFLKTSPELYSFKSTLLLGQQNTGSKQAQELLNMLEVKDKYIKIEDEIGVLNSYEMVFNTLHRLDFNVSYHVVKDSWLNRLKPMVVKEIYEDVPFKIILDSAAVQLLNVPVYVEQVPGGAFRLRAEADRANIYDFGLFSSLGEVTDVKIDTIIGANEHFNSKYFNFSFLVNDFPEADNGEKFYFVVRSTDGLTASYQNRLQAKPISRDSRILALSIEGSVPKKEIRFLNTLMSVYIERDLEQKNETGLKTVDFLDQQITQIADSLQRAEAKVATYRSANKIANPLVQSSMNVQKLEQLQSEKSKIITNSKFYQNTLSSLKTSRDMQGIVAPTSVGIETPVLNSLIIDLNQLNKRKAELAANSNRTNPVLETLNEQIINTKDALRENLVNMLRSSEIALQDVEQSIVRIEEEIRKAPEQERQLNFLQSKSSFNDRNYDFLLEKRTEAAISLATNVTDKKVIDKASMVGGGPTSPNRNFIMLVALMIGLVLPAGLILLLDGADGTIRNADDIKNMTDLPFLGAIAATDKNGSKLVMIDKPRSAVAESFRSLRINLQYISASKGKKVIGLTSTISGEGKTFCSVNLASELAISGKKTLLVEVDMRKPTQGKYLEYPAGVGLSTYLSNQSTLDEVIHKSPIKNMDIIASGPIPPNPIELVGNPEMDRLINNLKEHYDYIVLDIPPIGYVSEYLILLPYIDINLYVVRQKYTEKNLINQINEMQESKRINNLYIVMNGLDYSATYEYSYKKKGEYYYS